MLALLATIAVSLQLSLTVRGIEWGGSGKFELPAPGALDAEYVRLEASSLRDESRRQLLLDGGDDEVFRVLAFAVSAEDPRTPPDCGFFHGIPFEGSPSPDEHGGGGFACLDVIDLGEMSMASFAATRGGLSALGKAVAAAGFESVQLDSLVHAQAVRPLNAPDGEEDWLWNLDRIDEAGPTLDATYETYESIDGKGVTVYVVDSGIENSAPTLNGSGKVRDLYTADTATNPSFSDRNGHGTHVAGTIGSTTVGVAGGVELVNGEP